MNHTAFTVAALLVACSPVLASEWIEPPAVPSFEVGSEAPPNEGSGVCKSPGGPREALRTNRVIIEGRWAGKADLPLKPGDLLTDDKVSAAMEALTQAISNSSVRYVNSVGELHVLKIDSDCVFQPDGSVDFILRPHFVGLSIVRLGDNVLPIPRWREPSPYDEVAPILRTLLPAFAAGYDDASGTALSASINPQLFHKGPAGDSPIEQDLTAQLSTTRALDDSMYSDKGKLAYGWQKMSGLVRSATLTAHYGRDREPLDDLDHDSDSRGAGAGITLKLRPNTRLYLDVGYARQHEELSSGETVVTQTSQNQTTARALFEMIPRPILGFMRASLWANDAAGYQQLVARAAYTKELSLKPNQTLGIELTLGAGRAWGDVPEYARFHGGSSQQSFLYDGASSTSMIDAPGGPVLRSFGENAARLPDGTRGGAGGTRFWHINVDVALPIPGWSVPLIPDESADIPDANGNPMSIKQVMQEQVDTTGPNMLRSALVQRGLSQAEARQQSKDTFAEVSPAARYVINDANIFSIKPVLLLDAASLSDGSNSKTWTAAGVGVQLTVVTAKFEAGYSRTLSGPTFGSHGAPFARLVFQRLF